MNTRLHREDAIKLQLSNLVYRQLPIGQIAETTGFILTFYVFWHDVNRTLLVTWFVITCFFCCFRMGLVFYHHKYSQNSLSSLNKWIFLLYISAFIGGLSFAPLGFVFIPNEVSIRQTFIIVMLIGAITAGNLFYSPIKYLYLFYLIPAYLPHIVWLFLKGSAYFGIQSLATVYITLMVLLSIYIHRFITEFIKLQYDLSISNSALQKSEQSFRTALEHAPIGMAIVSPEGKWLQVNHVLCQLLGYSKQELEELTFQQVTHPDDLPIDTAYQQKLLEGKISFFQSEKRYIRKNGQPVWTQLSVSIIRDEKNNPIYFVAQIEDISKRKRNEETMAKLNLRTTKMISELRQHEYEMSFISKMNEALQTCRDSTEAFSIINQTAEKLFTGLNGAIIIYNDVTKNMQTIKQWGINKIVKPNFSSNDCWALREGNNYVVNDPNKDFICEHFESPPQGGYICIPLVVQGKTHGMLNLNAPSGNKIISHEKSLAITFSDVFKLSLANIQLREKLSDQAIHDPLTGLFNRRYMNEILHRELLRIEREKSFLCVAMLDLDYFKNFNDRYGHEAGDEILKYIGNLLKNSFRGTDIACRFGGEEFVVVLVNTDLNRALTKMQELRETIKHKQIQFQGQSLSAITISIGLVEAPVHGTTVDDILRASDEALYAAKQGGRDRVFVHQ